MNTNPVNLAVRFLLEIVMLIAFACWGWHSTTGWFRYIAAAGLPVIAATLWGVFRIPNDPKPAPVAIPGIVRLLLEWVLFGLAAWALHDLGYTKSAIVMVVVVVLHYIVSYDRTWVMLRNKPYNGFIK
jgi:hypothetical protein